MKKENKKEICATGAIAAMLLIVVSAGIAAAWTDDTNVNYVKGTITIDGTPAPQGTNYTVTVTAGANVGYEYSGTVDDAQVPGFQYGNGYYATGDQTGFSTGESFSVSVDGYAQTATGTFVIGGNTGVDLNLISDSTPPEITIVTPANGSVFNTSLVPLNYTLSEACSWVGYSLNGEANVTLSGNTTVTGVEGLNEVKVYALSLIHI